MQECQFCGEICYCDQDDCALPVPDDCPHVCADQEGFFDEDEEIDSEIED